MLTLYVPRQREKERKAGHVGFDVLMRDAPMVTLSIFALAL